MHPNEELARREIEVINAGDLAGLRNLYADDFVLHYPGRNPLAGKYQSLEDFLSRADGLLEGGTLRRNLHDALGTDDHAVQLLTVSAEVGGRSHTWRVVAVMHVRDGKFSEGWVHVDDQYALDEYLSSLG